MGDSRRFEVLADWVERNFPPKRYARVADVAGGQGYLSVELLQRRYRPTVIDPRKMALSKRDRKVYRRGCLGTFGRKRVEYTEDMSMDYDLVIGLHPDEATEAIARSAAYAKVVLVPCCRYWKGMESHYAEGMVACIIAVWKKMKIPWSYTTLKMSGKNVVLWTP